jgi:hypothetical protein
VELRLCPAEGCHERQFLVHPYLADSGSFWTTHRNPAPAATGAAAQSPAKPPSTYPQIVRLNYVEGDVRISRGKLADKQLRQKGEDSTGWEQAAANLPLEAGYSLVTGKGRAEIEFEDASTVYLADNSVLTFNDLSTTNGIPYTDIALLSGTATLDVHPMTWREFFNLNTPTDHITITYPQKGAYVRVDSYLDATSITPQEDLTVRQPGMTASEPQVIGMTASYNHGRRVLAPLQDPAASAEWDKWVATRMESRSAAMHSAMKDAGLTAPLPGLDALDGKGKFFACEPYGTCWEPTDGWTGKLAEEAEVAPPPTGGPAAPTTQPAPATPAAAASASPVSGAVKGAMKAKLSAGDAYLASHPGATLRIEDYTFPCSTYAELEVIGVDPITGRETVVESTAAPFGFSDPMFGNPMLAGYPHHGLSPFRGYDAFDDLYPWDWAVCHAGGWVRWQHHYVWVAGSKRHHHRPVRWVRIGHTVGWVPLHPRDVAGKPPINLKGWIFKLTGKKDSPIERVGLEERTPLKLLEEAPREYRNPVLEPLKTAKAPQALAYSVYSGSVAGKGAEPAKGAAIAGATPARSTAIVATTAAKGFASRQEGTPIAFDRKSQSFSVARQATEGGRSTTVNQPLGGGNRSYQSTGGYSNSGSSSRSYTPSSSGSSSSSRSYTPSPSSSAGSSSRPYTPAPSSSGGGGYSRPSAPAPSYSPPPPPPPPPAPAPSYSGGGASGGGTSPHK